MIVNIYKLIDPRDDCVRYVGKTIWGIKKRFNRHWRDRYRNESPKNSWLISLERKNLKPLVELIEESDDEHWEERERYWIKYYRELNGNKLTNCTDGGEDNFGITDEFRKRISESQIGRKASESTKKKISTSNIGKKNKNSTTKYRGIFWSKNRCYWVVRFIIDDKNFRATFDDEILAAKCRDYYFRNIPIYNKFLNFPNYEFTDEEIKLFESKKEKHGRDLKSRDKISKLVQGKKRNASTGYIGVSTRVDDKRFISRITKDRKTYHLGKFIDAKEAAQAYDIKARELFGDNAILNFP